MELDESGADEKEDSNILMNFEPNPEEALELIIPKYVTSLFYGALVESFASENGARMQAMDSATSNAEDRVIHAYPVMGRQACVSVNGQKGECII